ncbi:GNAT family N-acetyltransferase [Citrobacter farmeri]|uniref:GNAT family N-acetyltransferase n=1 Tax=Citrobacter farmeri TaxID=67824 RepID=UPI0018994E71|nr:GNAT family N-acetyltransferase [Citrobacter farmeri]EKU0079060.1 GNAT family N-acetyltransferase [Citrobacter farmeri]EKU0082725.1 GNAT family N-acetyltransferase [Citrobacter farmeri]MBJ9136956.1 GNAT family N-acetyltransferase [Citrobacter farmeri]MDB2170685.1 GNAT family N-acetyltransferase [Citrobacter farmeri]MDZ7529628.1 GNAT family N-acetyltransferase [Citrobacter farmeri]
MKRDDQMTGIVIERATLNDAEDILRVQKEAFKPEGILYQNQALPALTESPDDFEQILKHTTILAAKNDQGHIIGAIRGRVEKNICYVGRLVVHPAFQRQGTGSELLTALETYFTGVSSYELFTGSRSLENIAFYRCHGYHEYCHEVVNEHLTLVYMLKTAEKSE